MSSQSGEVVIKRKRVMLDSDEEERIINQKKAREAEKERKRLEKQAKDREIEERRREEKRQQKDKKKKEMQMMDFSILLEPDSNSHTTFSKIRSKIREKYPKLHNPYQKTSQKKEKHKEHKEHKERQPKQRVREKSPQRQKEESKPSKNSQVKLTKKQQIVYQLMRRWWYVTPEWLPTDIDYASILKKKGYTLLSAQAFRRAPQQIDGLLKVKQVDNYPGVFRRKGELIDLRPKENVPSIQNYLLKQIPQLMDLLRKALKGQIKDLQQSLQTAQVKPKAEELLLQGLKRQLHTIQK